MLLEFTVENYLSIKEPVTLSMIAAKSDKDNCENVINPELLDKGKAVLKSAVIYGANASGKSNIIKALGFMQKFIIKKSKNILPIDKTETVPFLFDEETPKQPSRFEVTFIQDEIKYFYGFALDNDKIYEEYLYHYPKGKQAIIFERKNTNEYKIGKASFTKITPENKLYLITLAQYNIAIATNVLEWFDNLKIIACDKFSSTKYTIEKWKKNPDLIISLLNSIDVGITDIIIEETEEEIKPFEIKSKHNIKDNTGKTKNYELLFAKESMGTKRFFGLIGFILDIIEHNKILIVDELESSFHTELTRAIIELFNAQSNQAQLIFTTHDTTQLSLRQFRQDQIYITEKDRNTQSTDLYSLFDIKGIRTDNIQKGYLQGKYGGVPFIDLEGVSWQKEKNP